MILDRLDECWERMDDDALGDTLDNLRECLERLTPNARQIVALRYQAGLSGMEVAQRLNRKDHTIYMALSRIHNTLRKCIEERRRGKVEHGC